jgi:N-hydroxyarylamine O-acetyltransferase
MDVERYLERLSIKARPQPDLAGLALLQYQHMLEIPFENLDVLLGRAIILDGNRLYEKIVSHRRGGFCYELNGLFAGLLRHLGFGVQLLSAGVYNQDQDVFGPEYDHMALFVTLNGGKADRNEHYLVDVGFGDSFLAPIPFSTGIGRDSSGDYRLQPPKGSEGRFVLERRSAGNWVPQYRFGLQPQTLGAYEERCHFHQTSPASSFTQKAVVTRVTPQGRVSLTRDHLTLGLSGNSKTKIPVEDAQEFERLLKRYFEYDFQESEIRSIYR